MVAVRSYRAGDGGDAREHPTLHHRSGAKPVSQLIRLVACFDDSQLAVFVVWAPCWRFGDIAETFGLEGLATDLVVVLVVVVAHQQVYYDDI